MSKEIILILKSNNREWKRSA